MKNHFSKENLENVVKESKSKAEVLRKLGLTAKGGNYAVLTKHLQEHQINCDHFTGKSWIKGKQLTNEASRIKLEDILKENVNYRSDALKKRLWKEGLKEQKCEICGISQWNKDSIILELHHINGDHYDNRLENLQILCPNCHSQTQGHRNRNKKHNCGEKLDKKVKEKNCPICNKLFRPQRNSVTYCSRECYNKSLTITSNSKSCLYTKDVLENMCNECYTITEMANKLNTSRTTIRKHLENFNLLDSFKSNYDFHSKKIGQYDLNGNLIKEWPSITDAEETLNITSIGKCLNGKRRSAGGFIWKEL